MASTPFFLGLSFLAWFTADVHSVKVLPDVLKGSSVVLSPDESVTSITSITWRHGSDLASEWFEGDPTFYGIFNHTCSLNTETGDLTISDVRPEHSCEYMPEINRKIQSAIKLRVLSPVPKPSIAVYCNSEETKCSLTCSFDRTDDLGDVEVFWILDDRHERGGRKIRIDKETKEEMFICSLKNSVSSENSFQLKNPLFSKGAPIWIAGVVTAVSLVVLVPLVFFCGGRIIRKNRLDKVRRILKEIKVTKLPEEHARILKEVHAAGPVKDVDKKLLHVNSMILRILIEGYERKLSKDSVLMLLISHYLILKILKQGPEGKKSLEKVFQTVQKVIERFSKRRYELTLSEDDTPTLWDIYQVILMVLLKKNELKLSKVEKKKLMYVHQMILRILREGKERNLFEEGFDITGRRKTRDPAEDPLIWSSSRFEVKDLLNWSSRFETEDLLDWSSSGFEAEDQF